PAISCTVTRMACFRYPRVAIRSSPRLSIRYDRANGKSWIGFEANSSRWTPSKTSSSSNPRHEQAPKDAQDKSKVGLGLHWGFDVSDVFSRFFRDQGRCRRLEVSLHCAPGGSRIPLRNRSKDLSMVVQSVRRSAFFRQCLRDPLTHQVTDKRERVRQNPIMCGVCHGEVEIQVGLEKRRRIVDC